MAGYADNAVRGSVENIRNLVTQGFGERVPSIVGVADEGDAEKGSKGMNIGFGALVQYYAVEFEVFPRSPRCRPAPLPVRERLVGRRVKPNQSEGSMEAADQHLVLVVRAARGLRRSPRREGLSSFTVRRGLGRSTRCVRSCSRATAHFLS